MSTRAQQFEIFVSGALYNGAPLSTGYAKFMNAGLTTTKSAYADKLKAVSFTTKALDAQGRAAIFGDGAYKIELYEGDPDDGGTLKDTIENVKCTAVSGNRETVTATTYAADRDDELILADTTSNNITITIADVDTFDNPITIKKIHADNTVTINPYSTQTIDGELEYDLTDNHQTVILEPDTTANVWRRGDNTAGLTASMAELNIMDGCTATYTELNLMDNCTATTVEINRVSELTILDEGMVNRSTFVSTSDTVITIGAGIYHHSGTTDQLVYWNSALTFTVGTTGTTSNDDSDDLAASEWHYLYLDNSAIVTQAAALLDADCFINNTTAPTWDATKKGWYVGGAGADKDDRCIFAFYSDGDSDILEFQHDGGEYVQHAQQWADATTTATDGWVDRIIDGPAICTKFGVSVVLIYVATNPASTRYRTNGQTADNGISCGYVTDTSVNNTAHMDIFTDSSQVIEIKSGATANDTISVHADGWYFPTGM
jgi:hypothetical protein